MNVHVSTYMYASDFHSKYLTYEHVIQVHCSKHLMHEYVIEIYVYMA